MHSRPRLIEFFGGPLDGASVPVPRDTETVPYVDAGQLHIYAIDETHEGQGTREVMRHVQAVPWKYGEPKRWAE